VVCDVNKPLLGWRR